MFNKGLTQRINKLEKEVFAYRTLLDNLLRNHSLIEREMTTLKNAYKDLIRIVSIGEDKAEREKIVLELESTKGSISTFRGILSGMEDTLKERLEKLRINDSLVKEEIWKCEEFREEERNEYEQIKEEMSDLIKRLQERGIDI